MRNDEKITAEMIEKNYWGWRRFLGYFQALVRKEGAAPSTRKKWRGKVNSLSRRIETLAQAQRELLDKLSSTCPHPVAKQFVVGYTGEDTLGNMRDETDYTITCSDCSARLAAFSSRDEGKNALPWIKS